MQILYIEDNLNDATLVKRYIETTGHELHIASNTNDAWAAIDADYDLILIDVLVDWERIGLSIAQKLRQRGYDRPLVAVTALTTAQDIAACEQAGFTMVLCKPFEITQLADVITTYTS